MTKEEEKYPCVINVSIARLLDENVILEKFSLELQGTTMAETRKNFDQILEKFQKMPDKTEKLKPSSYVG